MTCTWRDWRPWERSSPGTGTGWCAGEASGWGGDPPVPQCGGYGKPDFGCPGSGRNHHDLSRGSGAGDWRPDWFPDSRGALRIYGAGTSMLQIEGASPMRRPTRFCRTGWKLQRSWLLLLRRGATSAWSGPGPGITVRSFRFCEPPDAGLRRDRERCASMDRNGCKACRPFAQRPIRAFPPMPRLR